MHLFDGLEVGHGALEHGAVGVDVDCFFWQLVGGLYFDVTIARLWLHMDLLHLLGRLFMVALYLLACRYLDSGISHIFESGAHFCYVFGHVDDGYNIAVGA